MPEKLCIYCKHFSVESGASHYSDLPPENDWEMKCGENKWEFDPIDTGEDEFRRILETAMECGKFEARQEGGFK